MNDTERAKVRVLAVAIFVLATAGGTFPSAMFHEHEGIAYEAPSVAVVEYVGVPALETDHVPAEVPRALVLTISDSELRLMCATVGGLVSALVTVVLFLVAGIVVLALLALRRADA